MNWKKFILLLSCVVPCVFAVSTATAQMMGHRASTARMPMHRAPMHRAPMLGSTARMPMHRAPMLNSASGFQRSRGGDFNRNGRFRSFNRFNDGDFDRDDGFRSFNRFNEIIVFDNFGFPFFPFFGFPFYYSYPYYPYGFGGYGYQSGYDGYGYQSGGYGVNGSLVVQVQRRLASAGYYSGPIDGVVGSGTRRAIRAYERSHGLPIDGAIHRRLLATMGLA